MIVDLFCNGVDALNEWVGKAVSWLFLALIASITIDLVMRYFVGRTTDWAFDINYMIYGTNFMLAGAYALKHGSHVRVDVLFMRFSPKTQAILEIVFYVGLMLPTLYFLLTATWGDFIQSVQSSEISIVSAWHPPVYHYKGVMPLAFSLLILQSLVQLIRNIKTLAGKGGE